MARIDRLRDLADLLEQSITEATIGVRAQLAAQYRATLTEIAEIEGEQPASGGKVTALDEVNARRAARESGATRQA